MDLCAFQRAELQTLVHYLKGITFETDFTSTKAIFS